MLRLPGVGKAVAVFDMEGYSNPATIMPNFMVRFLSLAPRRGLLNNVLDALFMKAVFLRCSPVT